MNLLTILPNVLDLIRNVGEFQKKELTKVESRHIIEKDIHSLVSYVDIESEKLLVSGLQKLLPESDFITEENTIHQTRSGKCTWIIDPLDGTTNYLNGIPVFSISVALLVNDELQLGIIYHVMMDEMFYAMKENGAFLNDKKIQVSQTSLLKDAVVATGFPYQVKNMKELSGILQHILNESRGVRRLGSAAIDLAYTSCGRFDAYYEAMINPWDVAAGILLMTEAGGNVTDMNGAKDPLFAKNILACNSYLQEEMLGLILKVRAS
ncbi:MAG: inositol monophosphatase [Saprospiraceae bacterium]|nr:inositol monophosphatase [Saprospiraceae bacterium]